ncbi:PHP domain-containing protein [Anaerofilum sp. BX8]|uniref:PHP domain-containing protein n=1 Tax=Anaerofilum hominis TaxID=2763016 RepID=A0A923IEE6_9FIRM|nr:PHP domain-containing protein [Anaerofilum hominis]MBC5581760.1 PHP domain-containing protein [Anaerofilum hominis]
MPLTYDLHLHSCLSPCGDNAMTPANIAGFARLNGIGLISLTDHNSAENLPYIQKACAAYGVKLLPGIEMNTAEEIHLLCYLPTVEAALCLSREIYALLPEIPCDEAVFGEQIVMDEEDHELRRVDKLLVSACGMGLEEAAARCAELGGVAVPAHVDRESYSILSVLGIMPEAPAFSAVEVHDPARLPPLIASGRLPQGYEILTSSDAHYLEDISAAPRALGEGSCLQRLIRGL